MISAILLAAGQCHRFGREKLQQCINGKRVIDWAIEHLLAAEVDEVILVVDPETKRLIAEEQWPIRMKWTLNLYAEEGMSHSIRCGLEICDPHSGAVLICHADMPLIDSPTINRLVASWNLAPDRIVAPRFRGVQGNPVILPRRFWPEIEALRGDVGCKSILNSHATEIKWVEMTDDRILLDVDTEMDLAELRSRMDGRS